jgi:uncharacterized repeat protein (TIGR03803 family)
MNDGGFPEGGVIEGLDGLLYGTTRFGGAGFGTVFSIPKNGTGIQLLVSPSGGAWTPGALVQGGNGRLFGTMGAGGGGGGELYSMNPNGSDYSDLHDWPSFSGDGFSPAALILGSDGYLYGTTYKGGSANAGTIFKVNTNGAGYIILYNFTGNNDGAYPLGGLLPGPGNVLYGTTSEGGAGGVGIVYSITNNGTGLTVLHGFSGPDGSAPEAGLIFGNDGALYGTTTGGGTGASGTVFKVNPDTTGFAVVHDFAVGADGQYPYGELVKGNNGVIYGTTFQGGANGVGTIFELGCLSAWSFDTPTAVDACSGVPAPVTVLSTVTNGPCPLTVTRIWLATDSCGNTNTCSQTVTVIDTTPPTITYCPSNIVVCSTNGCGLMPDATILVQATNNSAGIHVSQNIAPGTILCSNSLVTFTVSDNCGNQVACSATVTVGSANAMISGYFLQSDGFHIIFPTQPGFIYEVQYTGSLSPVSWVSLKEIVGDGTVQTVVDPKPLVIGRFYRLERLCP